MKFFKRLSRGVKSAWKSVTGTGSDPGALGTGKKGNVPQVNINRQDYYDPHYMANRQQLAESLQSNGPQSGYTNIAPNERATAGMAGRTGFGASTSAGTGIDRSDLGFRSGQQDLISNLQAQANGQGPNLAEDQLKKATARNIAQQMAVAGSGQGNPALAARAAAGNAVTAGQDAATQAAQLRMQQQLSAQQQLADVLSGARGQDIGVNEAAAQLGQNNQQFNANQFQNAAQRNAELEAARQQFNAGLGADISKFNAGATNATNTNQAQLNQGTNQFNAGQDAAQRALNLQTMQTGLGLDQQQINNIMDYYNARIAQNTATNQINSQNYNAAADRRSGIVSGLVGAGAAALMMSDKTNKKDIEPADSHIKKILDKMGK